MTVFTLTVSDGMKLVGSDRDHGKAVADVRGDPYNGLNSP